MVDGRWRPLLKGPLVALLIVGSLSVLMAASNLVGWAADRSLRRTGVEVPATVAGLPSGTEVTVSYTEPGTGTPRVLTVDRWDTEDPLAVGDAVAVQVDPGNPTRARLAGDHYPIIPLMAITALMPAAFPLALLALRVRHARRAERLAGSAAIPTYQVLGRLAAARSNRHPERCELQLYPLDDPRAESRPLAVVPLLAGQPTPLLPPGAAAPVTLQVKGQIRPYGLVVASTGDRVLWPSGPARRP